MTLFDPTFCSQSLPLETTQTYFFVERASSAILSDSTYFKSIKANKSCQSPNLSRQYLSVPVPVSAHSSCRSLESNSRAFRRHPPIHTRIHLKKAKVIICS